MQKEGVRYGHPLFRLHQTKKTTAGFLDNAQKNRKYYLYA